PWLLLLCLWELPWPLTKLGWLTQLTRLALLPCEAFMRADAMARTLWRLLVSRRGLLQWTTAAQLSRPASKPSMLYWDVCFVAGGLVGALSFVQGAFLAGGLLLAALWLAFPALLPFLEQPYHRPQRLTDYMREELARLASETYLYFDTVVTDEEHHLPPDNIQLEPNKGVAHRTSPTNIGLYLTSLIAAEKLGLLAADEMARRIRWTVETLEALPKWNGHLYNWYDTRTLSPLQPLFVSSVDSGNLAVCLLCCAQGLRVKLAELPASDRALSGRLDALAESMRFDLLFDWSAELFGIGVHPGQPMEALSHYDLLASESRLLSFVAILLGQVPVRHWHRLGRSMTRTRAGRTLVSYSGTMFEYMMPLLFLPPIRGTLLHDACAAALREQRAWKRMGAFGVSESGYFAFDPNLYYQYKAFGIPALAMDPIKRQDVIAPYASILALTIDARAAFLNLKRMEALGWESPLGLFEAADFQKERIGARQPFRVVRSHMSHHQGMILCALCNALCGGYLAELFFGLPRAQAFTLLLEEKPQSGRSVIRHPLKRREPEPAFGPLMARRSASPCFFPVDAHLLHGAGTTLLIDAQGGGYIARDGVMGTRFHESCAFASSPRFYLRDSQSGAYWSLTDPTVDGGTEFETAQAVFTRGRMNLETTLRAFVGPLDGAALHLITLRNTSSTERMVELCSYLEPALAPQREDAAHPAFQNLFIRTSRIGAYGVMATRRPREEKQEARRLMHLFSATGTPTVFQAQTDRMIFLGRGHTPEHPQALAMPISASREIVGDVIEPCLSLRAQFVLPAGGQTQCLFATLIAAPHDAPAAFCDRYATPEAALKLYELAQTQGLVTARYLGMDAQEQCAASRLCSSLVYTGQPHQHSFAQPGSLPLKGLWGLGLSGDLPMLLALIDDAKHLPLIRLLLKAHAWYRMSGLWCDLVVICDQLAGYEHPLRD
ncbi:MAG: glucoamylase family protein, partial [Eubacteriales bacterium]|nr:glucoamylase family protein [Eubacteriales bacterium]